jgi:hypothetical protein
MSSQLLKELMRQSETLTSEEKLRLANHLVTQATKSQAGGPEANESESNPSSTDPDPKRRREQRWLREHAKEYEGQWVALNGDRLLSHGTDGRLVLSEARQAGVPVPFVVRVEMPDELPFGGW